MNRAFAAALAAAIFVCAAASDRPASAEDTLTVCLNEHNPPYSQYRKDDASGFDLAVAQAVAKRLGRSLAIQWFESERDEASSLTIEANALLADGRCAVVAGFPLIRDALEKPGIGTARLPDFEGKKPSDRRRKVELQALAASKAYHYAPLTVVLGGAAASKHIESLADLQGVKLGIEGGTLSDAILMIYDNGRYVNQITHLITGRGELLPKLEQGEYDATLVQLHRFDVYRAEHPYTKITASGYYYRIGFNMGFVGLATGKALMDEIDKAIGDMLGSGELPMLAQAAGMTYVPPHQPDVLNGITYADLLRN